MNRDKNFVDRSVFNEVLGQIDTATGGKYQDSATIYGDLSRLVVAFIAATPPQELQEIYNKLGWGGSANVRAIHEAANHWYQLHHPDRLPPRGTDATA
jgi:hypothetical protein